MLLLAGALTITPVTAACEPGVSYERWAATDGAAGRINLEDVQTAFRNTASATDFERFVNEIYEGDGIILVRVTSRGDGMLLEGWEDLNQSGAIEMADDDLLFSIVRAGEIEQHQMSGFGANGYYHEPFGAGESLFTYMLLASALSPGPIYYETSPVAHRDLSRHRASFRNSEVYRGQVSRNTDFFGRQSSFAGSRYVQADKNLSANRQKYLNSQRASGSYKTSATGVRSSWGSSSRNAIMARSRAGFMGGGGGGIFSRATTPPEVQASQWKSNV